MKNTYLSLDNASYILPNGRTLFENLSVTFDDRHTGLVGRNGVGKSILASILAEQLTLSSGRFTVTTKVHYLSQQVDLLHSGSVAQLAGVHAELTALDRIESGSYSDADFETLNERWNIRQLLQSELKSCGLGNLLPSTPVPQLSGGEAMQVALIAATLSEAGLLILDEPTNHLDRMHRQMLTEKLRHWTKGLLVISHDRSLLETMDRIVELTPQGLNNYGGPYSFYAQRKYEEQGNALAQYEKIKLERKRELAASREQHERIQRRSAEGKKQGKRANQANILLGRQKEKSEASKGKFLQKLQAKHSELDTRLHEAEKTLAKEADIALYELTALLPSAKRIVDFDQVVLPYLAGAKQAITLSLYGRQRIGLTGPNGAGKSTLLKLLAGKLSALAGECCVYVNAAYLDQQLTSLLGDQSVLQQILAANPKTDEGAMRTKLNQLGLDSQKILMPCGQLSCYYWMNPVIISTCHR